MGSAFKESAKVVEPNNWEATTTPLTACSADLQHLRITRPKKETDYRKDSTQRI
jgi:hypothetical protein